jgi:hypothetical protein
MNIRKVVDEIHARTQQNNDGADFASGVLSSPGLSRVLRGECLDAAPAAETRG